MERLQDSYGILAPTSLLSRALPRVLAAWLAVATIVAIVATQGDEVLLRRWLWATLAASFVGICFAVWWTAGIALRPVRSLTRRLQQLDSRAELQLDGPAEISELADSLSHLLGELHRSSVFSSIPWFSPPSDP